MTVPFLCLLSNVDSKLYITVVEDRASRSVILCECDTSTSMLVKSLHGYRIAVEGSSICFTVVV